MDAISVIGPTVHTQNLLLIENGQCVATVKFDPDHGPACRATALFLSRAPNRTTILKHLLCELEGDDEGQRHQDLIAMIKDELVVTHELSDSPKSVSVSDDSGETRMQYYVRCGSRTVEIATSEDWWIVDQSLNQPERDSMEIWACDAIAGDRAIRLHPSDSPDSATILTRMLEAARPEIQEDEIPPTELFSPDRSANLARQEQIDTESQYREAMGFVPTHPTPEGPVERHEEAA